jgi:TPR repeat protein
MARIPTPLKSNPLIRLARQVVTIGLLAFVGAGLLPIRASAQTAMQLFEQGFDLYAKHDYPAAERAFQAGIDKGDAQPDDVGLAHYFLAEAPLAQQRPSQDAMAHYREAVRLIPQKREGQAAAAKIEQLGILDECDRLAADRLDPDLPDNVPGAINVVDGPAAVTACGAAAKAFPNNRRVLYELGRAHGAAKNGAEGRVWLERAAEAGSMRAMFNLGYMYDMGIGVEIDYAAARKWYDQAAAVGGVSAILRLALMTELGHGRPANAAAARALYRSAADRGDPSAMIYLAMKYHHGQGVRVDIPEARRWYLKAIEHGNSVAMNYLARTYDEIPGQYRDYAEARRWYEKASARQPSASERLGDFYARGLGVPRDVALARHWYEQAAAGGSDSARKKFEDLNRGARQRDR